MWKNILGDIKTTAIGVGLAVAQVVLNGRSGKQLLLAVITAALGAFSTLGTNK
jgi:hypothetical protein